MCDGFIHPCESIALAKGAGLEVKDGQEDTGERQQWESNGQLRVQRSGRVLACAPAKYTVTCQVSGLICHVASGILRRRQ